MLHYEQVFINVFEKRESKCCGMLMKHCGKVYLGWGGWGETPPAIFSSETSGNV